MKIRDMKPQVGIFELVEDVLLVDSEDTESRSMSGRFFSGNVMHLHANDVKRMVAASPSISQETKMKFAKNGNEYLNWPRGRVDYDIIERKWHIMAARRFFTQANVERVTRAFYLPPYSSGKIVLEADENHYGW